MIVNRRVNFFIWLILAPSASVCQHFSERPSLKILGRRGEKGRGRVGGRAVHHCHDAVQCRAALDESFCLHEEKITVVPSPPGFFLSEAPLEVLFQKCSVAS